jgi:hypothetical protein
VKVLEAELLAGENLLEMTELDHSQGKHVV